ncbi:MAG: OmpA family protein, partial [Ghiorsea sp.]|nr:OmpA family protein [Ghiorsea sp.]
MISKHYSKMALVAVAAASLVFAGCGGKKDDMTMNGHAGKSGSEMSSDMNSGNGSDGTRSDSTRSDGTRSAGNLVAKPATNAVYFAFNSARVNGSGKTVLVEYAAWLNDNSDVNITVEGNCDERGSREYNLALGEERSKAVKAVLVANGVSAMRIDTVSFG